MEFNVNGKIFTDLQLDAAFKMVANPMDWKAEIVSAILPEDKDIVEAAIEFYTATKACFRMSGIGVLIVTSEGYRNGPAGP